MIRVPSVNLTHRQTSEEKQPIGKVNFADGESDEEILYQPASRRPFKIGEKAAPIPPPTSSSQAVRKEPQASNAQSARQNRRLRNLRQDGSRRTPIYNEDLLYQDHDDVLKRFWQQVSRDYFQRLTPARFDELRRNILRYDLQHPWDIESIFNQHNYISTYREEVILSFLPELQNDRSLRVLMVHRDNHFAALMHYVAMFNVQGSNSYQPIVQEVNQESTQEDRRVPSINISKFQRKKIQHIEIAAKEDCLSNNFQLLPIIINDVSECYEQLARYTKSVCGGSEKEEIEREIDLWVEQLNMIQNSNSRAFNRLQLLMEGDKPISDDTRELQKIDESLIWSYIIKHFKEGHTDKTEEIFESYQPEQSEEQMRQSHRPTANKGKNKQPQKFETDCKICFCSANHECNKVLYCDDCNTSYHQYCYGLSSIPKSQFYYCDTCTQQRQTQSKEKPWCKICQKKSFPMKKIDGHFYHVTCLVLNNFVEVREKKLRLKKGVDFEYITRKVIESQLRQEYCEYCVHQVGYRNGIQMKCSWEGCQSTFHPICGYLYGCSFELKVIRPGSHGGSSRLDVKTYCNHHIASRNFQDQIYFRWYVCNYSKTSELTKEQYQVKFDQENQKRLNKKEEHKNFKHIDLGRVTKSMKHYYQMLKKDAIKNYRTQTSRLIERSRQ